VLVESPTYLGAVMAFTPMEPEIVSVESDSEGIDITDLERKAGQARFLYVLPNFQNPSGRTLSETRRSALTESSIRCGLPLLEDNPYGDLWFDAPPPATLSARNPQGCIYLGSFSKILAPGLRLGYMVAPKSVYPKLLQAKQAADLHSPGFNQRVAFEVMQNDFLQHHTAGIRALYRAQRDAMLEALTLHFPPGEGGPLLKWNRPAGGMFLWARLREGLSAAELLPRAVARGVAFVPGAPFFAGAADTRCLRLSFVTPSAEEIREGVSALAQAIREMAA
jgi:2-aminoadipate transaminase